MVNQTQHLVSKTREVFLASLFKRQQQLRLGFLPLEPILRLSEALNLSAQQLLLQQQVYLGRLNQLSGNQRQTRLEHLRRLDKLSQRKALRFLELIQLQLELLLA